METRHAVVETQLGELTLVASGDALVGVYFPGHWTNPNRRRSATMLEESADPLLAEAARQLRAYLAGDRVDFDLPTATRGGAFEEQVWSLLRAIPFGETVTYGELAVALGERTSVAAASAGGGAQPAVDRRPVPPRRRQERRAPRLRRRTRAQALPARPRGRRPALARALRVGRKRALVEGPLVARIRSPLSRSRWTSRSRGTCSTCPRGSCSRRSVSTRSRPRAG